MREEALAEEISNLETMGSRSCQEAPSAFNQSTVCGKAMEDGNQL